MKNQGHQVIPLIDSKRRNQESEAKIMGFTHKEALDIKKNRASWQELEGTWSWESGRRQRRQLCRAGRTSYPTRSCTESSLKRYRTKTLWAEDPDHRISFTDIRYRSFEKLLNFDWVRDFLAIVYIFTLMLYKTRILVRSLAGSGYRPGHIKIS